MNSRFRHNNSHFKDRRITLRNNATPEEKALWYYLKNKKLGFKFLRQHSIGPYIVDFYCPSHKLVLEIDGLQHIDNKVYDLERTQYLEMQGCKVLRFWNYHINTHVIEVLHKIEEFFPN